MSMTLLRNLQTSLLTSLSMNLLMFFLLKMNRIKYYKPIFFWFILLVVQNASEAGGLLS